MSCEGQCSLQAIWPVTTARSDLQGVVIGSAKVHSSTCSPPWSLALQPPRCRRPPTCSRLDCNLAHLQALCSASLTFGAQMAHSASIEVGASTACASCPHSSWAPSFMSRCGSCSAWAILFEARLWIRNGPPMTGGHQVGPCGAARIGYGDSVLNDPDSRRLSVMVACEWSHARCEWSLTQRPRVGRSLGPGAAQRGHPKPPSRAPKSPHRRQGRFPVRSAGTRRIADGRGSRPPHVRACTHNSKFAQLRTPVTYVLRLRCCASPSTAHPGRFCVFQRTQSK